MLSMLKSTLSTTVLSVLNLAAMLHTKRQLSLLSGTGQGDGKGEPQKQTHFFDDQTTRLRTSIWQHLHGKQENWE
jgi:hypothetical protein